MENGWEVARLQRDHLYSAIKTVATVTEEFLRAPISASKGHMPMCVLVKIIMSEERQLELYSAVTTKGFIFLF